MTSFHKGARVYVAGHGGLVGSALLRKLADQGFRDVVARSRKEMDLMDGGAVDAFFRSERPVFVFFAAGHVGGILANDRYPADFIRENLAIQYNVIDAARRYGVEKLLFLGSSCIYPRMAPQPIHEDSFLSGPLEPTNRAYAVAKIAGIEMCRAYWRQYGCRFISVMPTNLYGPGDTFDLENGHVLPALIRRFHEAKLAGVASVSVWGSGSPRREFLHVDDLAGACMHLMRQWDRPDIINVGTGQDVSIADLATLIRGVVGYPGEVAFDTSRPDGTPRKLLHVGRLAATGWSAAIPLEQGIVETYRWYVEHGPGSPD